MNEQNPNPTQLQLVPDLNSQVEVQEQLEDLLVKAKAFAEAGISDNTRRSYQNDWNHFSDWCDSLQLDELPASASTVAFYLTHLAEEEMKVSTIRRRMATISKAHRIAKVPSPIDDEHVKAVYTGIRRTLGVAPTKKKALITADIQAMLAHLPDKLIGVRDRALLLLGFVLFNRRSELARLTIGDLEFQQEGVLVWIRKSKTDQEGIGEGLPVHYGDHERTCPVLALQTWLEEAEITEGPIFRRIDRHGNVGTAPLHDGSIARIIKKYAQKSGLDPNDYSGHSLRRGGITTALRNGASVSATKGRSRHRRMETFQGYIEEAGRWRENITVKLGL